MIKALSKLTVITGELIPKESGDQFAYFIYRDLNTIDKGN